MSPVAPVEHPAPCPLGAEHGLRSRVPVLNVRPDAPSPADAQPQADVSARDRPYQPCGCAALCKDHFGRGGPNASNMRCTAYLGVGRKTPVFT
jgi:hypothetical protein